MWIFRNSSHSLQLWNHNYYHIDMEFIKVLVWAQIWGLPPKIRTKQMGENIIKDWYCSWTTTTLLLPTEVHENKRKHMEEDSEITNNTLSDQTTSTSRKASEEHKGLELELSGVRQPSDSLSLKKFIWINEPDIVFLFEAKLSLISFTKISFNFCYNILISMFMIVPPQVGGNVCDSNNFIDNYFTYSNHAQKCRFTRIYGHLA